MTRVLLLGGTTEASRMATLLADAGLDAVFSYAGRTLGPMAQPLPSRIGGFGGAAGLAAYLRAEAISHVIDATHPFAARMSGNALSACATAGVPLIALERPEWVPAQGDRWTMVPDLAAAAAALPERPARVFLAIGRQHLGVFAGRPEHRYLLRLVDPAPVLLLTGADAVVSRGPFTEEGDLALLRAREIEWVVTKNSGGEGARAKLDAARRLGVPVIVVERPRLPPRHIARHPAEVMDWLGHAADRGV